MKPSREPYGRRACAFTDGFTLTYPPESGSGEAHPRVLRFENNWCAHFAPQPSSRASAHRGSSSHRGEDPLIKLKGWR